MTRKGDGSSSERSRREGQDQVKYTFQAACAIIESGLDHPDPVGALERVEAEAPMDEKYMFPALWEALTVKLNDTTE
jgi:hypothetical protein